MKECQLIVAIRRQDDALQTKTNEVTDALRRTAATMRAELDRSVLATQLLGSWFRSFSRDSQLIRPSPKMNPHKPFAQRQAYMTPIPTSSQRPPAS